MNVSSMPEYSMVYEALNYSRQCKEPEQLQRANRDFFTLMEEFYSIQGKTDFR